MIIPTTARWVVHGVQGRNDCINYIKDSKKTDGGTLVTGINCSSEFASYEMKMNNDKFHFIEEKESRTCYHGYQSFDPKEKNLTPDEVHQMGIELMKRLYPNYQVLVATHIDRGHLHNHFIVNAVDMSGKKLEDRLANPKEGLYGLRDASDEIALEHGLKIIEDAPKIGRFHKNKYLYNLANKSWKAQIIEMLESLKEQCFTFDELLENLAMEGYQIKSGKNIRIKPLGKEKFVTMKVLGEEYSEESLRTFFYDKRSNNRTLIFQNYKLKNENSEILQIQSMLADTSKQSILLSMKGLDVRISYPKYYNSRFLEVKRFNRIVDRINFLNENNIFSYTDLQNRINELKEEISSKEKDFEEQQSQNETLQLRVPLCDLFFKYLDYYEHYLEQKDMVHEDIELSDEVKTFLQVKEELQVTSVDEVKDIVATSNRVKMETNRQYAYLSYLKNKINELEKIKGESIENSDGYIKSISFSKRMIDETRTDETNYCIRVPYSELYVYIPKENVAWFSYNNRAVAYLIDDKEYDLYNDKNEVVKRIYGEELEKVSKEEKQKISEYYKVK